MLDLESAWKWRESSGIFNRSNVLRVFHGPGEGRGKLQNFAVDRFGDHYWVTEWATEGGSTAGNGKTSGKTLDEIIHFLKKKRAESVVGLRRPMQGVAPESCLFFGDLPTGKFEVQENACRFLIQFEKTRHPGLFLDHEPLRRWLLDNVKGRRVLNTFAYTGSLSVAAGIGGASEIQTLDLSQNSIAWAKENFSLNGLDPAQHHFTVGDVFEWLPRLKRGKNRFDCIILDPPSFAHGKAGRFSTSKDLQKLHHFAMELLSEDGILITSINSENVTLKKYEADVLAASEQLKMRFLTLGLIEMPDTFPTSFGQPTSRYLKGWILKRI